MRPSPIPAIMAEVAALLAEMADEYEVDAVSVPGQKDWTRIQFTKIGPPFTDQLDDRDAIIERPTSPPDE